MSLQNQLDAFREQFESGGPPFNVPRTVIETVHRGIKELTSSGQLDRVTKVGALAPGFALKDYDGQVVKSAELLKRGPLVVTFNRGAWCPYCNLDLKALQAALPDILSRGATLVAISPQNAANSRKSIRQHDITFPILSDPGGDISAAYGLRYAFPDYLIELYKSVFRNDLALVNDDSSWTLPMPARFVIRPDGMVVYAEASPDYTRRPDPSELVPTLDRLKSPGPQ
ncbi:MAG: peroxiredoxin-like family protein [Roseiarcus sp.]